MKKLSLLLIALTFVFVSCDLSSPDRSEADDRPSSVEGDWLGVIYNAKSGGWAVSEMATAAAMSQEVDLKNPLVAHYDQLDVEDGVLGLTVTSDKITLYEVLYKDSNTEDDDDDIFNGVEKVVAEDMLAELASDNPAVGYMVSGDLELKNITKYDSDGDLKSGYPDSKDTVNGTVHFPGYDNSDSIEEALTEEIYSLLETTAQDQAKLDSIFGGAAAINAGLAAIPAAVGAGVPQANCEAFFGALLTSNGVDDNGNTLPDDTEDEYGAALVASGGAGAAELQAIAGDMATAKAAAAGTVTALENDLRDAHKAIIKEYIEVEDIFGFVDGDYAEGGLSHSGTDQLKLLKVTWGYDSETGENDFDVIEILCQKENYDWMLEGFIRLNSVGIGRYMASVSVNGSVTQTSYDGETLDRAVAGAFADPRWSEIQDIDE